MSGSESAVGAVKPLPTVINAETLFSSMTVKRSSPVARYCTDQNLFSEPDYSVTQIN